MPRIVALNLGLIAALLFVFVPDGAVNTAIAKELPLQKQLQQLSDKVQAIKSQVLLLGQDVALLDRELMSLKGNQIIIYLSLDINEAFVPQTLDLELDNQPVVQQIFTRKMINALYKGGAQKLYVNALEPGEHRLKASLSGKVGRGSKHRGSVVLNFEKESKPKTIELRITNVREKFLPEFAIKEWD